MYTDMGSCKFTSYYDLFESVKHEAFEASKGLLGLADHCSGSNFMTQLTVSKESTLTEAGNSVLRSRVFHGLAGKFGLCLYYTLLYRHSTLTQLAQKFALVGASGEW